MDLNTQTHTHTAGYVLGQVLQREMSRISWPNLTVTSTKVNETRPPGARLSLHTHTYRWKVVVILSGHSVRPTCERGQTGWEKLVSHVWNCCYRVNITIDIPILNCHFELSLLAILEKQLQIFFIWHRRLSVSLSDDILIFFCVSHRQSNIDWWRWCLTNLNRLPSLLFCLFQV